MGVGGRRPNTIDPVLKGHHPQPDPSAAGGHIVELEAPPTLSEGGRIVWDVITPELVKGKVLRGDDIPLLIEACEAWAFVERFRRQLWEGIEEYDRLVEQGHPEDPEQHDAYEKRLDRADAHVKRARASWTSAYKVALSAAGDLGLGPTARVRLGLAVVQGQSLLESLTQGVSGQKDG